MSSLTIKSLNDFLSSNDDFEIYCTFTTQKKYKYILLLQKQNFTFLLLDLGNKLKISLNKKFNKPNFVIEQINVDNKSLFLDYNDHDRIKQMYNSISSNLSNYTNINLDDISDISISQIKRQAFRFNNWVCNLQYKLCILNKHYLCCTDQNNNILSYRLSNKFDLFKHKTLYITSTIEYFLKNQKIIVPNISKLYTCIFKNLKTNSKNYIEKYSEDKNLFNLVNSLNSVEQKLNHYVENLNSTTNTKQDEKKEKSLEKTMKKIIHENAKRNFLYLFLDQYITDTETSNIILNNNKLTITKLNKILQK